jgi:hypothetical protein
MRETAKDPKSMKRTVYGACHIEFGEHHSTIKIGKAHVTIKPHDGTSGTTQQERKLVFKGFQTVHAA